MGNRTLTLRPDGVIIDGRLERGLEVHVEGGQIVDIARHSGIPDGYVLSAAFINTHSHLEYRGFQDAIQAPEYYDWIYELTNRKLEQSPAQVRADCRVAAEENRRAGVAMILEHTDRPGSAQAMKENHLGGFLFHEVITTFDMPRRKTIVLDAHRRTDDDFAATGFQGNPNPHAPHTVDATTLKELSSKYHRLSIHVGESLHERMYWESNDGKIAERRNAMGLKHPAPGSRLIDFLQDRGYVREGIQWVHACDLTLSEVRELAMAGVSIAHCPRSNTRLKCPVAPVREMLDLGMVVGLGLDSPASGGPINMFAEMKEAIQVSTMRGFPITAEEAWRMATCHGARTLNLTQWDVAVGSRAQLIKINGGGRDMTEEVIFSAMPEHISWVDMN